MVDGFVCPRCQPPSVTDCLFGPRASLTWSVFFPINAPLGLEYALTYQYLWVNGMQGEPGAASGTAGGTTAQGPRLPSSPSGLREERVSNIGNQRTFEELCNVQANTVGVQKRAQVG